MTEMKRDPTGKYVKTVKSLLDSTVEDKVFADHEYGTVYKAGRIDGIRSVIAFLRGSQVQEGNRCVWNKGDDAAALRFADRLAHEVARLSCPDCVEMGRARQDATSGKWVHEKALGPHVVQVKLCRAATWLESLPPEKTWPE